MYQYNRQPRALESGVSDFYEYPSFVENGHDSHPEQKVCKAI